MTKKRITALALLLVLVCVSSVSMASTHLISRRSIVRNSINVDICVQNGNIVASCRANLYYGSNPSVNIYLQKQINGVWITVSSGSGTLDAKTSTCATSGSYRACASLKVTESKGNASSSATLDY